MVLRQIRKARKARMIAGSSWFEMACTNVLIERRRYRAALAIQRAWREYKANPFRRMERLSLGDPMDL